MTKTKYYDLQMDEPQDDYDVEVVNANLKKIDEQMKTRENATDALQEPEFTVADKRENIASKEKMPKILGKIAKFFTDLKTVAFSGKYSDLDGKPAIVNNNTATEAGSALDARQANPTIEGTMANQISQLNSDLSDSLKYIGLYYIDNFAINDYGYISIQLSSNRAYLYLNTHIDNPEIILIMCFYNRVIIKTIIKGIAATTIEQLSDGKIKFANISACRGRLYEITGTLCG